MSPMASSIGADGSTSGTTRRNRSRSSGGREKKTVAGCTSARSAVSPMRRAKTDETTGTSTGSSILGTSRCSFSRDLSTRFQSPAVCSVTVASSQCLM